MSPADGTEIANSSISFKGEENVDWIFQFTRIYEWVVTDIGHREVKKRKVYDTSEMLVFLAFCVIDKLPTI